MVSLKWPQVTAWRLSQQYLSRRAPRPEWLNGVSRLGGVQAQLMSAAELALWSRVESLAVTDVETALWEERSLVKTWAMRGTLHLVHRIDFPLFVSAHAAFEIKRPPSYYTYHGVTPEEMEAIGAWQRLDPQAAIQEVARRYLAACGPATADNFARWWGTDAGKANKVFRAMTGVIQEVEVGGWQAWGLSSSIEKIQACQPARQVQLLPQFDPYTLGVSRDCEYVLPGIYRGRIYRPQGWISAVVLVAGKMEGTWETGAPRLKRAIKIDWFDREPEDLQPLLAAEVSRLSEFVGAGLEVENA